MQIRRPAAWRVGWLTPAVWTFVLACSLALPTFWNSQVAAQQTEPKPATPDPTASTSTPQATTPENAGSTLTKRVQVNVVNVPVTVLGRNGQPVIDLNQNDFQVFEDGKPQAIKYFLRGSRPPLRIGLVMDTSNSARRQFQFQKDAATEFVFNMLQSQKSKNEIFLETFDATSSLVQDFTNDPQILNEKILALKAGGGKAVYDAIYYACREKMLKSGPPSEYRRVLVLISDGLDAQSTHTLTEVISMAHKAETLIYSLGNVAWGYDNPGNKVLKELSEQTGGAALFPRETAPGTDLGTGYLSHGQIGETSQNKGLGASTGIYGALGLEQLADSLEAISRELTDQYSIGYTPTNDKMDGTYRTIHVVALRKGVEIRFKPGYFATVEQ